METNQTKKTIGRPRKETHPEATTDTAGQSQQTTEPTPNTSTITDTTNEPPAQIAPTPKRVLIYCDKAGFIKTIHDLNVISKYFNDFVNELRNLDLLPLGLSNEMAIGLCYFNPKEFVKALEKSVELKPTNDRLIKRLSAQTLAEDIEKVRDMISNLQIKIERERLQSGLCLQSNVWADYIKATNDEITFNVEDVKAAFTEYAETPEVLHFMEEARQLFDAVCKFDKKARQLSRGRIRGFGDSEAGAIPEIIGVYNGKITLDFAPVAELDFSTINNEEFTGQYEVVPPLR